MTARPRTLVFPATGLTWLAAVTLSPDTGHGKPADRYASIAAHQTAFGAAMLLFLLAGTGLAGCAAIAGAGRGRGRGAAAIGVGAALLVAASSWLVIAYAGFYSGVLELLQQRAPRTTTYQFIDTVPHPWSHVFDLALLAFLLAPILLATGLHRAGRVSWLSLALWVVGFVVDGAFEFTSKPASAVGVALCAAALALLGHALTLPPTSTRGDLTTDSAGDHASLARGRVSSDG